MVLGFTSEGNKRIAGRQNRSLNRRVGLRASREHQRALLSPPRGNRCPCDAAERVARGIREDPSAVEASGELPLFQPTADNRISPKKTGSSTESFVNDPSAGSPTETLLRLLLPLNDQVRSSSRQPRLDGFPPCRGRSEDLTKPFNR